MALLENVEPAQVADLVVEKLQSKIEEFSYKDFSIKSINQIASKPDEEEDGFITPWLGVFYAFIDEGETLPQGHIYNLPVTIGVICSSTPGHSTETEALREAMIYATKVLKTAIGEYSINYGTVDNPEYDHLILKCSRQPIEILEASADFALVGAFFEYKTEI